MPDPKIVNVVRAKMFVTDIAHKKQRTAGDVFVEIKLVPVYGDSAENKEWSKYTPQGEVRICVTNPTAVEAFELDQEYYVDFIPVPKKAPATGGA